MFALLPAGCSTEIARGFSRGFAIDNTRADLGGGVSDDEDVPDEGKKCPERLELSSPGFVLACDQSLIP